MSVITLETLPNPTSLDAGVPEIFRGKPSVFNRLRKLLLRWGAVPPHVLFGPRGRTGFGILMYHRITPWIPGFSEPTHNVTPERFRQQMRGVLQRGFEPWPLRKVLDHTRKGEPVPRNAFVVTFDDGYRNNYEHAWPILRELGIPATIFLATAYLDSAAPFPFDDWEDKGKCGVPENSWQAMTREQVREMAADPLIDFGVHTHHHADFRNKPELLAEDLKLSLHALRELTGQKDATFAFPYGTRKLGFSGPPLSDAARSSGVLCSLTTEAERVLPEGSPFDWGRFTVDQQDNPLTIAAKLSGWLCFTRRSGRELKKLVQSTNGSFVLLFSRNSSEKK